MKKSGFWAMALAGAAAGTVAGLFGAGGGLVLVPLLTLVPSVKEEAVFPVSLSVMLPICAVCLMITAINGGLEWNNAVPYVLGGGIGGLLAAKLGHRVPVLWLHRALGLLILWGGIRYLC